MVAELLGRRDELAALCARLHVLRLEAFGSAVAGGFTADSDLDFLVEFDVEVPGYADRYFDLLDALEELFGRPVDLVMASAIRNPFFRESVDRTRTLLYAA